MKDCAHVPELSGQQLPAAAKARPTIEELREYLDYDPETGVLRWKKSLGQRARVGQITGSTNGRGYSQLQFNKTNLAAHRVAFALYYGRWPTPCCDHINCVKTDNRIVNLRECSAIANAHNAGIRRDNKTGVKGVRRNGSGYTASVSINGAKHRKYFRRLEDAAAYAKQLREQLHGEFVRHE
jgi:hypothetical protein